MLQEYSGPLVHLRPLEDDDLDTIIRLYRSTPNYWSAIGYGRDPVSKLQLQSDFLEAQRTEGRHLFAIVRHEDNSLIGVADVQLEATMSDTATIALLLIGGPYQQYGYGSEAADLVEQALFSNPEIEFITAGVAESSRLGQRFWLRRGYQYSGSTTHDPQTSRTTVWLAKKRPAESNSQDH
jgi:RimJ/RimL family protein N-acetyltransferase